MVTSRPAARCRSPPYGAHRPGQALVVAAFGDTRQPEHGAPGARVVPAGLACRGTL